MTQHTPKHQPDGIWAWDILWVGLLAIYAFAGYRIVPFHGDESMQIFMSRDYAYHIIEQNAASLAYDPARALDVEQNLRIINGTLNKYSIGLAWHLGGYTLTEINAPWYWEQSFEDNYANGNAPTDALLLTARVPSALFLAGAVVLIFFVALRLAGRGVAYMSVLYFALNPTVLVNGRRAMMEGSLLFGMLLTVLAGILWSQHTGWRRRLCALLLALGAGLAVSSKHTNVVSVAGVFVGCALGALLAARATGWRSVGAKLAELTLAGVLSVGLFVALNPAWWGNPVQTAQAVLAERVALLEGQTQAFGGYPNRIAQFNGFFRQVFVGKPMYYEVASFREPLAGQIATYEADPFSGVLPAGVAAVLFGAFVLGMWSLLVPHAYPPIQDGARWVVAMWGIFTLLFVWLATPLEWQRYYLPILPLVGLLASVGVGWVFRLYKLNALAQSPQYLKGSRKVS